MGRIDTARPVDTMFEQVVPVAADRTSRHAPAADRGAFSAREGVRRTLAVRGAAAAVGNPGAADSWWPRRRWRTGCLAPRASFESVTPSGTPGRGGRSSGPGWSRSARACSPAESDGMARAGAARLRKRAHPRRDCDRARGRLARTLWRTTRRQGTLEPTGGEAGRRRSGAERPGTSARPRTRSAKRGLAFPGCVRDLHALPDAGLPLHRRVRRKA